jgi:hypothetical protein
MNQPPNQGPPDHSSDEYWQLHEQVRQNQQRNQAKTRRERFNRNQREDRQQDKNLLWGNFMTADLPMPDSIFRTTKELPWLDSPRVMGHIDKPSALRLLGNFLQNDFLDLNYLEDIVNMVNSKDFQQNPFPGHHKVSHVLLLSPEAFVTSSTGYTHSTRTPQR